MYISVINDIDVPVKGNGKNMVYTDGTNECVQNPYFGSSNNGVWISKKSSNIYVNVGTGMGDATKITEHLAIGLNTNSSRSGVILDKSYLLKYYFIIKY